MKKILVVDDDDSVRRMIFKMLGDDYEIFEASDGREGTETLYSQYIDLLITDIIMPDKEGLETITEVKSKLPELKILAISGGGKINAKDYLLTAKALGAHSTLAKPFLKKELLDIVSELLGDD
jgi:DNA-binding NtrC family response regulator